MSAATDAAVVVADLDEAVASLAWSGDGRLLAVADLGGQVSLLDLAPRRDTVARQRGPATRLPDHPGGATVLAWHPVRPILASGGHDGTLDLWSAVAGRRCRVACGAAVRALAWSPTGDLLAVAAGSSVLVVDDHGVHVAAFPFLAGAVHALAWVPGPASLAAGTHDGVAWLEPGLGAEPVATDPVAGAALVLAADPSRSRLASGDLAGAVRVTDLASDEELCLRGWAEPIDGLAWDAEGRHLVVASDELSVFRLDGIDVIGDAPIRLHGHDGPVTSLAFGGPTGTVLATGGDDGLLARWRPPLATDSVIDALGSPVHALAWHPEGTTVAAGTRAGTVVLLDES